MPVWIRRPIGRRDSGRERGRRQAVRPVARVRIASAVRDGGIPIYSRYGTDISYHDVQMKRLFKSPCCRCCSPSCCWGCCFGLALYLSASHPRDADRQLSFERAGEQVYRASVATGDLCRVELYQPTAISGASGAVRQMKYWATLFGLDGMYRLDRIEGRYRDVREQTSAPPWPMPAA